MTQESNEAMLSRLAREREEDQAGARGLTVEGLKNFQRLCRHEWRNRTYYDECPHCDAVRG